METKTEVATGFKNGEPFLQRFHDWTDIIINSCCICGKIFPDIDGSICGHLSGYIGSQKIEQEITWLKK